MDQLQYFLKIDGIVGESLDSKHKGEIELQSFSWGETRSGVGDGGRDPRAGKVSMQDFHFTMQMNKASPQLLLATASGEHLKLATLTGRAGRDAPEFLVFKFSDLIISSYETEGAAEQRPVDQVSVNFGRIDVEYRPQKPDGSPDAPIRVSWDVKANRPI